MSMLSAQCDNLRKMADKITDKGTFVGYGGCVSKDALMHDSAIVMRAAAETIEALSAKLNAECDLEKMDYCYIGETHVFKCSVCGRTCEYLNGSYEYCPHCGRKASKR